MSCFLNIFDYSDIQNNIVLLYVDDYMLESYSMYLFGNGFGLFFFDDFNFCFLSDCGEDDEDDEIWIKIIFMEVSQSEGLFRLR